MLNRIRIGQIEEEDIAKLQTRVRTKNHPDLAEVSLYIGLTKHTCVRYNREYLEGDIFSLVPDPFIFIVLGSGQQ